MSATAITIRLARLGDADTLALMSRDLVEAGLGWQYGPRRMRRLIAAPNTIAVVACDRDAVAGFAVMEFADESAHLMLLAVEPGHQRQGTGRRLLEWLLQSAVTAGIATVQLELRVGNAAARAFYRNMGFTDTALLAGYYRGRESALRMECVLRRISAPTFTWRPPTRER